MDRERKLEVGWMDGWMDGWVGGWMDGWMGGRMGGWEDGWMAGWVDGRMGGWMGVNGNETGGKRRRGHQERVYEGHRGKQRDGETERERESEGLGPEVGHIAAGCDPLGHAHLVRWPC